MNKVTRILFTRNTCKKTITAAIILAASTGCGKSNTSMSGSLSAAQVYFFSRPQVSGDGSAVYRLNLDSGALDTVVSKDASSTDMRLYRDPTNEDLYVLERFAMTPTQPSKITRYKSPDATATELTGLPINAAGLLRLRDGSSLVTGYQDGDVAIVSSDGKTVSTPTSLGLTAHNKSLLGSLRYGDNTFVISGGFDAATFTYAPAQIHTLNATLSGVTSSLPLSDCINASRMLAVSAQVALLSCNPQYSDPASAEKVRILKVDVSGGTPQVSTLFEQETTTALMLDLGGLSSDKSQVFVTSLTPVYTPTYHEETTNSQWLNVTTGASTTVTGWGGKITTTAGRLVTSCILDGKICKKQTFGVFDGSGIPTASPREITVNYSYTFDDFSTPLAIQ